MRVLIPLVVLVVLGGLAWFLLADPSDGTGEIDDVELLDEDLDEGVMLRTDPEAIRIREAREAARRERVALEYQKAEREAAALAERSAPFFSGTVRAGGSGESIRGARVWLEPTGATEASMPQLASHNMIAFAHLVERGDALPAQPVPTSGWMRATALSDEEGAFAVRMPPGLGKPGFDEPPVADAFAFAEGYVARALGRVKRGTEREVVLDRGLRVEGVIVDPLQRPLAGARVIATPAPGTANRLGHYAWSLTDGDGRFVLSGLLPGAIMLRVEAHAHMPLEHGPVDPTLGQPLRLQMVGGLLVFFVLEPADGVKPVNPILSYTTDAKPPESALTLLSLVAESERGEEIDLTPEGAKPPAELVAEADARIEAEATRWVAPAVLIPCRARNVRFEIKAESHAIWRSELEPLPVEGGQRTIEVRLQPGQARASLEVAFRDASGQAITYTELSPSVSFGPLDGQTVEGGAVIQGGATMTLKSVPPGRYRVEIRAPSYAPVSLDLEARLEPNPAEEVELVPAAKVRVQFVADESMVVPFHFMEGDRIVRAWPEQAPSSEEPQAEDAPLVGGASGGDVFTGLGAATYRVVVTGQGLTAPVTSFTGVPGETVDVEIRVERR